MKNKKIILIVILLFFLIFFLFLYYKFQNKGNTINNKDDLENKFFNISNYEALVKIKITSNKTENVYEAKQIERPNYSYQEVINGNNAKGFKMELKENVLKLTNTTLNVEKIFEEYKTVSDNSLFLSSFIEDYKNEENEKEISEDENEFKISIIIKDNLYIRIKELFIEKKTMLPNKMIIFGKDKKEIASIIYTNMEIN